MKSERILPPLMEETVHILNDAVPSVQRVMGSAFNREGVRSSRFSNWPEWITLTVYAALIAFAIPFHEPFVDEAQSWQLAQEPVATRSISNLSSI